MVDGREDCNQVIEVSRHQQFVELAAMRLERICELVRNMEGCLRNYHALGQRELEYHGLKAVSRVWLPSWQIQKMGASELGEYQVENSVKRRNCLKYGIVNTRTQNER